MEYSSVHKVQRLLPWELHVLAGMAGLFAALYEAPALAMLFLLLCTQDETERPRWAFFVPKRWRFWTYVPNWLQGRVLVCAPLILTFMLAWLYAFMSLPADIKHDNVLWPTGKAQRITGRIASVSGLPDQRLRIVLKDVRPVNEDVRPINKDVRPVNEDEGKVENEDTTPLSVVWTWEKPDLSHIVYKDTNESANETEDQSTDPQHSPSASSPSLSAPRPVVGQKICATLAIKPVDMLANPDSFDLEQFWAMKGIFHRAWARGHMPELVISPSTAQRNARPDALWREQWRLRMDERLQMLIDYGMTGIGRGITGIDHGITGMGRAFTEPNHTEPNHADEGHTNPIQSGKNHTLRTSAASILMGMLFGDRYAMDSELLNHFARTDLLHTLALSGQHLIIAGFFASLCVFILRRNSENLLNILTATKLFFLLSLPCALFYLWLGNAPPSLVRASTMLGVWTLLCFTSRHATLPDALLGALACILIISPLSIFDLGLQLSSIAVLSLGASIIITQRTLHLFGIQRPTQPINALARIMPHQSMFAADSPLADYARRVAYAVAFLVISSTVIQIGIVPIQLMVFGTASPWFLLNVLWIPIADLMVLPLAFLGLAFHGLGMTSFGHIPDLMGDSWSLCIYLGDTCLYLALQACQGIVMLLEYMHNAELLDYPALWRPHWTTALGYGGLLICLLARMGRVRLPWPMRRLALGSAALFATGFILMAYAAYDSRLRLTVFDVGMGQALYIRTPDNVKILIDGGGFNSKRFDTGRDIIARALTDNQWPRLDMVLNTHPDNDHLRGLIHLVRAFPVHFYGYNGDDNAKKLGPALDRALERAGLTPQALFAGMVLDLGSHLSLEILHPQTAQYDAGNNASIVARLVYTDPHAAPHTPPKGLAMFCGDVEAKGLRQILAYASDHDLDVTAEVLILPHHGAKGAFLPAFYDAVQPRIAIASCAKNHRYNYPNPAIQEALAERKVPLFSTGHCGALYVDWVLDGDTEERDGMIQDGVLYWERAQE